MTDNEGGGSAGTPTATNDKVFILSTTEIYGDLQSDGAQYEYYATSRYSGPRDCVLFQHSFRVSESLNGLYLC